MSSPFVGEIRMVGFNFAPSEWAWCSGQVIQISQNETLFTLIGTTYGGDGINTFSLPNFQSRVPIHQGNSSSGTAYILGQTAGAENASVSTPQMPGHTHTLVGATVGATTTTAAGNLPATSANNAYNGPNNPRAMAANAITPAGQNLPHTNIMPFLTVNFVIALFGIYPSQS